MAVAADGGCQGLSVLLFVRRFDRIGTFLRWPRIFTKPGNRARSRQEKTGRRDGTAKQPHEQEIAPQPAAPPWLAWRGDVVSREVHGYLLTPRKEVRFAARSAEPTLQRVPIVSADNETVILQNTRKRDFLLIFSARPHEGSGGTNSTRQGGRGARLSWATLQRGSTLIFTLYWPGN